MKSFLFSLLFIFFGLHVNAQFNPVHWSSDVKWVEKDIYEVQLVATVDAGWYIYSQHIAEGGPIATTVYWEALDTTDAQWQDPRTREIGQVIEGFDKTFEMNIRKYKGKLQLVRRLRGQAGSAIKGSIEYMSCEEARCLPPKTYTFHLQLPEN